MSSIRPRRTALYVPASNERAIDKALGLDADVVILDLEDAVAPEAKAEARNRLADRLPALSRMPGGPELVVRVNGSDTPWGREDLRAIAAAGADALLLPKISTGADIEAYRSALASLPGGPPPTRLWAMIETPRAVLDPLGIVAAAAGTPPLDVLVLGLNDLSHQTGTRQVPGRLPMLSWMMNALAAARTAGLAILDGVFLDLSDGPGLVAECAMARDCGFDGKTVIHPSQVEPCNDAFTPTPAELEAARRVVAAFAAPENAGRGALKVDGRMVERLHADLAARRLGFAAAIEQRRVTR